MLPRPSQARREILMQVRLIHGSCLSQDKARIWSVLQKADRSDSTDVSEIG